MPTVTHKLRWFRKDNDEQVGEADLSGVSLRELRRVFGDPSDDPRMALSYEVSSAHKPALQARVNHQIRLDRYAYLVECDAAATPAGTVASK